MSKLDALVCRRSPHLVCYWRGADFVIENYATAVRVSAPPITSNVLAFFDDWRPIERFLSASPAATHGTIRTLLSRLIRHSLLQRFDRPRSPREQAMDAWQSWNPAAGFFHTTTKDMAFFDMDTQVHRLREKSRTAPMPDPIKSYRDARRFPLPSSDLQTEFTRVLGARRTWRQFSRGPVDYGSFGTLLGLTAGVQRWANVRGEGTVALKTSPSGGARHSIELYTLALRVNSLPAGLYHYAPDAHALELLDPRVSDRFVDRYLPKQPWYKPSAATVFFAAVFPRELWRYNYARAYRAVLIEAGHLCQTFCLTATWLGLAPFCTMALADSRIEKDLGLDGISESVLYAAGVGTRPTDAAPPATRASRPSMLTRREVRTFPGRIVHKRR
jgi:SagB-type dehydrogenase family enzyme